MRCASRAYLACLIIGCLGLINGCNLFNNPAGGGNNNGNSNAPVIDADNNPELAGNPPAADINGNWQFAGSGDLSGACITLATRKISVYDVDCDGSPATILNSPVGYIGGTDVTQGLAISLAADGSSSRYAILTFYLVVTDNNTMTGTAAQSVYPDDVTTSHDVVWHRQ